ncbi:MAG TPA: AN1-type zinc finger protein [Candidatus Bathyarchaeia archaeon]|nr:AN1-type zinc finger protein [Candidatus Bathyarchaeia archaeon]
MAECDFEGCPNFETLPFTCKYCGKTFCRFHRLPENHACEKIHLSKSPLKETKNISYKTNDISSSSSVQTEKSAKIEKPPKKLRKVRIRKDRRKHSKKEKIYATSYEDESDHPYYATDGFDRVYTQKPTERQFQDNRFLSLLGDSFTVGREIFDFLIGLAVIAISWSLSSIWMSDFTYWYYTCFIILVVILAYTSLILPQKILAKRNGYTSRYILSKLGLLFTLLTAISPIRLLSPGTIVIPEMGIMSKKQSAIISSSGIVLNLFFGIIFLLLGAFLITPSFPDIPKLMLNGSFFISQLVLFSLLPFRNTLGRRIMDWNWFPYLIMGVITAGLLTGSLVLGVIPFR